MDARAWFDASFSKEGAGAQRRYPNEELVRFFGRHYFSVPVLRRQAIRVLDIGCGSGANLWMIAAEGFDVHGIDASPAAVEICRAELGRRGLRATVETADMAALPYPTATFDVLCDVFSSYCLNEAGFTKFAREIARVLKPDGRLFLFTPSKQSDVFWSDERRLDAGTLDGIRREDAPYSGNLYPFRFAARDDIERAFAPVGLEVEHCERVGRTYRDGTEYFEWLSVEASLRCNTR